MEPSDAKGMRELLGRFLRYTGLDEGGEIIPFVQAWHEIAGMDIAAHSQVVDVKNGAVHVKVDHPGWSQRLLFQRERIVAQIRRRFPTLNVRYLHVSVGELEPRSRPDIQSPPRRNATESEETDDADVTGEPEGDPELAEHMRRLRRALERGKSRN